jgi:hypothetical protein
VITTSGFPAMRSRNIVPTVAIEELANETACCLDVAAMAAERRLARQVAQLTERR